MIISLDQAASRPLGVAQSLVGRPLDAETIYRKRVVLTGEASTLATANGRWCFLYSLALLERVVGKLIIALPIEARDLQHEVADLAKRLWSRVDVEFVDFRDCHAFAEAHAVLNVGSKVDLSLPWTSVNSNGWVARVSSRSSLSDECAEPNPVAAMFAASQGAAEIFKRIFEVPHEIAPLLDVTEFSLFHLSIAPPDAGPVLPGRLMLPPTLLTGAGAIGTALAPILAHLEMEGRLHIIDCQNYQDENLGTCMLMEATGWVGQPKAIRLRDWLLEHSKLDVTGECIEIERAIDESRMGFIPQIGVNALDAVEARRNSQRLWPSVLIDGGINEVGAAVTLSRADSSDRGCLMCWFETSKVDEKNEQSRWTGLDRKSLLDIGRELTDEDIAAAATEKQPWLQECKRRGKTVCSIITEGQLAARLGVTAPDGFRPSVPFVASASAALVAAALVKAVAFPNAPAPGRFQLGNLFLGPESNLAIERRPNPNCQCVTHRALIGRTRRPVSH